ncbi:MAG TPA: sigma-70 family RNA polymerase sigma factor [Polyangiaceae bacterium]
MSSPRLVARLADPDLTARLSHFVRTRVPEDDARDIVQATIADALAADEHPEGDEDIVRWVFGICRHKLVDWFRRMRREVPRDLEANEDAVPAESVPTSAMDLMRWARKELPPGKENEQTLEWMLREGDGEKLESIAAEANLPAPRVRQRVSRLRRYYKKKWAAQAAAVAALLLVALAIAFALRKKDQNQVAPRPEPSFVPSALPPAPVGPPELPPSLPAVSTQPDAAPPAPSASAAPSTSAAPTPMKPPMPTSTSAPVPPQKPSPKKATKASSASDSIGPSDWNSGAMPQQSTPVPSAK